MEEKKDIILDSIIRDLADNYSENDEEILYDILDDVITNAFFFSKRKESENNLNLLSLEIKECVKTLYLQRGAEDVNSTNKGGISSNYKNALNQLRQDIIKNGKRIIF